MANLKGSIPAGGRVEGIDLAENLLAVATSTLGGNIWDASLRVVDLSTKEVVASVQHPCGCAAVSWAKYGKQVVCAEDSGDVKVYKMDDAAPVRLVEILALQEHDDIVSSVATSRVHDALILSGSYDRSIIVWDIAGDRRASLHTFTGHSGDVTGVEWAAGEDGGQVFASSSTDGTVRLWDRRQSQGCSDCHRLEGAALSLSWEPSSEVLIAVGCEDGTLSVLDKRLLAAPVSVQRAHKGRVNSTSFRPARFCDDGQNTAMLASVGDDGMVTVRTVGEESSVKRMTLHSDYAQALAWRDDNNLVTGGWDSELFLVELGASI